MSIVTTMAKAIRFQLAPAALTSMWTEKENIAEDMKAERFARAALRAIKPEDVSDTMLGAFGAEVARPGMGNESPAEMYRRALAAMLNAAGAEQ